MNEEKRLKTKGFIIKFGGITSFEETDTLQKAITSFFTKYKFKEVPWISTLEAKEIQTDGITLTPLGKSVIIKLFAEAVFANKN